MTSTFLSDNYTLSLTNLDQFCIEHDKHLKITCDCLLLVIACYLTCQGLKKKQALDLLGGNKYKSNHCARRKTAEQHNLTSFSTGPVFCDCVELCGCDTQSVLKRFALCSGSLGMLVCVIVWQHWWLVVWQGEGGILVGFVCHSWLGGLWLV